MFNDDPDLLKKVITSDESWVYGYNIHGLSPSIYGSSFANCGNDAVSNIRGFRAEKTFKKRQSTKEKCAL